MGKPVLSILIPTYNAEKTIRRCINSIQESYKEKDIEIIVLDDGSEDSSLSIIEDIALNDPRVTYETQVNHGTGYTRNRLLEMATGEYIWFVDADDYVSISSVSSLVNLIKTYNQVDIIAFLINLKVDDMIFAHSKYEAKLIKTKTKFCTGLEYILLKNGYYFLPTQIIRLSRVKSNNLKFNQKMSYLEDLLFSSYLYTLPNIKVLIHYDYFYTYDLTGDDSVSRNQSTEKRLMRLKNSLFCHVDLQKRIKLTKDIDVKNALNYLLAWTSIIYIKSVLSCRDHNVYKESISNIKKLNLLPIFIHKSLDLKWKIFCVVLNTKYGLRIVRKVLTL